MSRTAAEVTAEWRAANPERNKANIAAWRAANPEHVQARNAEYHAANAEWIRTQKAAYRLENRESINAARAARRAANPERWAEQVRAYAANHKARKKAQFVEHVDPAVVWDRDGGICHICREVADASAWHLEHVVPLARGGNHSYANTAVSHPSCNQRKSANLLPAQEG